MAEENQVDSIVTFSEDVSSQEAPPPLPTGDNYEGVIKDAKVNVSKTSGKRYAAITFVVSPDQYPPDFKGPEEGVQLSYNRLLVEDTAQARYQIRRFCESIGAVVPGKEWNVKEIIGLSGRLKVGHDTYEGVPRAQLEKVSKL